MAELLQGEKRTLYCGELREGNIGQHVCLMGWVQKQRDLGSLVFVDLRDRTGIVQLTFDENTMKKAATLRSEYVICVKGDVRKRESVNDKIPTGQVEVLVNYLKILSESETPPFEIVENSDVKEELRLKHRYLDLRRPDLQRNIIERHKITQITRRYFDDNGFLEIETPVLIKPTPEGAKDYLVPSRVHNGKFYALPQSPQLYKQILMASGFDRYFQVARCFRDEDLRADRQPEFTQIDLEMSFVEQDDVMRIVEGFIKKLFAEYKKIDIPMPLMRMTYAQAMNDYGSDKPDLRFGLKLCDISDIVKESAFKVFSDAVAEGGSVRAINAKGAADKFSRKGIDALTDYVKRYRAKGLAWIKNADGNVSSSFLHLVSEDEKKAICERLNIENGDIVFIVASNKNKVVFDSLGALRCELARKLDLIDKNDYKLLWITEFPMFEEDDETGKISAMHHPFTSPMDEDLEFLETDPLRVRAKAYDIVINGNEAGGGSVRIHSREIQKRIFACLGLTEEEANNKFGFLLEAFKYGVPPHAGLAFGLDRLCCLLIGLDAIRDVIAFPKVQNASELMSGAPSFAEADALDELGIAIVHSEE